LHIKIANPSNTTIKLRKHLCLAEFCAVDDVSDQTKMENIQKLLTNHLAQEFRLEPSNQNLTNTQAQPDFSHVQQLGQECEQQMPIRQANFSAMRCSRDSEVELSLACVNKNESEARNVLQPVINETPYTLPKTT
jgi:hypothetical protein